MKKILLLSCALLLLACQNQSGQEKTTATQKGDFSEQLKVTTNRTVKLLPEARAEVSQWLAYATAQDEIASLREKTGNEIVATSNSLLQIMESLRSSLPDSLRTTAVIARANVLLTKASVLHQLSEKKQKDATEIYRVANDLIVEFDNFKLQLNELFLKSPGDFEIELDQEFEEAKKERVRMRDSVRRDTIMDPLLK
jgi:hypothetical protein